MPSLDRIAAIDILRGFAIIGVVLNHLWDDIRNHAVPAHWYYARVGWDVRDGEWSRVPTALFEAILRGGYLVPLFMMLSGLSLYMATARKPDSLDIPTFYRRRFRQLIVPYWFAVVLTLSTIIAIAIIQVALHGGGFAYQYHHVTEGRYDYIAPGHWELVASVLLIPRAFSSEWLSSPPPLMWFVVPILQYYLLFPFLLRLIGRIGVARFALTAFAATIAARLALIVFVGPIGDNPARYFAHAFVPFRFFEFALGMSLGYLLVHHRERLREIISRPAIIALMVVAGFAMEITGVLVDERDAYIGAVGAPIVVLGVALLVLPMMLAPARRLEVSAPGRLLAWVGPLSFAVLIASEPIRLVASLLRVEQVPTAFWWLFLVLYFPMTFFLARPIARLLGLGRQAKPARPPAATDAPMATSDDALATAPA